MRSILLVSMCIVLLTCAGVQAMVEMKGQLKGFAGSRGKIGANKVSVVSKVAPTVRAPPPQKVINYTKPMPSAYNFDPLKKGISGKPKKFLQRKQI